MALVRFNATAGTWELRDAGRPDFRPISIAAAQRAMIQGIRQAPMWRGPGGVVGTA